MYSPAFIMCPIRCQSWFHLRPRIFLALLQILVIIDIFLDKAFWNLFKHVSLSPFSVSAGKYIKTYLNMQNKGGQFSRSCPDKVALRLSTCVTCRKTPPTWTRHFSTLCKNLSKFSHQKKILLKKSRSKSAYQLLLTAQSESIYSSFWMSS